MQTYHWQRKEEKEKEKTRTRALPSRSRLRDSRLCHGSSSSEWYKVLGVNAAGHNANSGEKGGGCARHQASGQQREEQEVAKR